MPRRAPPEVLFLCVHNAGRSQMAAAFLRAHAGDTVRVRSAGTIPADQVHPVVVAALAEVGLDIGDETPSRLTDDAVVDADVVVSMGCDDACPVVPGKRYVDWDLPDPAGLPLDSVRRIRDEIERRVLELLEELTSL